MGFRTTALFAATILLTGACSKADNNNLEALASEYEGALKTEREASFRRFAQAVLGQITFELIRKSPCSSIALQLRDQLGDPEVQAILIEMQSSGGTKPFAAAWKKDGDKKYACNEAVPAPVLKDLEHTASEFKIQGSGESLSGRFSVFYSSTGFSEKLADIRKRYLKDAP
jgi:hypothetical protein